jgi:[CysO sulfur-carrier protein]-S-L-cysteine hydrolase
VLRLDRRALDDLIALAYDCYPEEACGLIAGRPDVASDLDLEHANGTAEVFYRCRNTAASARVYTIDPHDHLRAEDDADERGLEINGVVHSHTHSEPYPSPTDVAQAPDPGWHYVIVSLKREVPEVRSYRIVAGGIHEEPIEIVDLGTSDVRTGTG